MPRPFVPTSAAARALVLTALLAVLPTVLSVLAGTSAGSAATSTVPAAVVGGDVSWPQCPVGMGIRERRSLGLPLPGTRAQFVVIGLTNGPARRARTPAPPGSPASATPGTPRGPTTWLGWPPPG